MDTPEEVDATYFEVIDRLNSLKEHVPDLIELEHFPKYLVCGVESVGKTTLLEAIAGVPLGYKAEGTATRCPVEYTLVKHPGPSTDSVVGFTLGDSKNVEPLSQLTQAIRAHMLSLGNHFSSQVLRVRVVDPDLKRNMIFLDTPGFKPNHEEYKPQIEQVVQSLAQQRQYSLIVVYKHNASVANNSAPVYCAGVLDKVRPGWDKEKSTIFVYNQLNSTVASEFRTLDSLQSELDGIATVHREQKVFNLALKIKGSPYEVACDGPQPLDRSKEIEALRTIEYSEMDWLQNLPNTEPYVGLVIPEHFRKSFGVKNLVGYVHQMWKKFVDDNARTLVNELSKKASRERADLNALVAELESKRAGLDLVRENIDKYKDRFLDHFQEIVGVRGEIACKKLEDPLEVLPPDFIDLSDSGIFAKHIDKHLADHLSLVDWNSWDAFRKIATQQRVPPPVAPPPQEPVSKRRMPAMILEGPSNFPSVTLSAPSKVMVKFEDLKPSDSNMSWTYTLWYKSEGEEWTPDSKLYKIRMCTKDIDMAKTLWVFVEINDNNMRSKITRFDPSKDLAVHDAEQDQALLQAASRDAQRAVESRTKRPEQPVTVVRSEVLAGDLANWQKMFGSVNWAYRSRKAHGVGAIERLVNSYALVLFNAQSNESDLEPLTRISSQQGDGDSAAVIQHCLKSMINQTSGGTSLVAKAISRIVLEYPSVVFNYLSGSKLHQSMETYVKAVEELILDQITEVVQKDTKDILEDWQEVFTSLGNGWKINFLDPIVMAMCMSDILSSVPSAEALNALNRASGSIHLTQLQISAADKAVNEEFNKNMGVKRELLESFGKVCANNYADPRKRFDPVDMAFPCILSPMHFLPEQMRQVETIARLQGQAKEIFWHMLNVALPVLRAHVHDRLVQGTLGRENLRQRLEKALKKKEVHEDEESDIPPMDFVERIVNTKAFRDGISQLENKIAKKKRAMLEIVAAKGALDNFLLKY